RRRHTRRGVDPAGAPQEIESRGVMARTLTRRKALAAPLAALTLAACGRRGDSADPNAPKILLRGNGPDPDSVDPHRARSTESMQVLRELFEGLTRFDHASAPIPGAAESWSMSEDGRVYTFKLRPNLRWSN